MRTTPVQARIRRRCSTGKRHLLVLGLILAGLAACAMWHSLVAAQLLALALSVVGVVVIFDAAKVFDDIGSHC